MIEDMIKEDKGDRTELLRKIRDEVAAFHDSPLYEYRMRNKNFPVIGQGSHFAKIMFIGEGPGKNEAKTGRPFCGRAGRILDELLESANIKREDVYVTNIVKDRPPSNRDPLPEEIEAYGPFLDRQIEIIRPEIIATLGRFSMQYIMEKFGLFEQLKPISQMHGRSFDAEASYGKIKLVPLYHPAVAIYNPHTIETLKEDFSLLTKILL